MIHLDRAHLHPARIDLILLECADRANCKVFYGYNLMMQPWACYYFQDIREFESAHQKLRTLSDIHNFETMESLNRNREKNDGVIYVRRPRGGSLLMAMKQKSRTAQLQLCQELASAMARLHEIGGVHGALDEDNVVFDELNKKPVIVEFVAEFHSDVVMPPFRAPEQWHKMPPTQATDVYQLAAAYLSAVREPSKRLQALIDKCQRANPEERPSMAAVEKDLSSILQAETSISLWPKINLPWLKWMPHSTIIFLLGLLCWLQFPKPDSHQHVVVSDPVTDNEKVWVNSEKDVRSFAEFAHALAVVTGKPVTYPSSLDSREVVNPDGTQKWEEVLFQMGLGWEIQIVKIKPGDLKDPETSDRAKPVGTMHHELAPIKR